MNGYEKLKIILLGSLRIIDKRLNKINKRLDAIEKKIDCIDSRTIPEGIGGLNSL